MSPALQLHALPGIPKVRAGDDLVALTRAGLAQAGLVLQAGDVLVYAQKIVSKAEGRQVDLRTIVPGARALQLAPIVHKDARLVELVLRESRRVVRAVKDVLIVEHRLGLIMANAGIDQSNVAEPAAGEFALLLPEDPDASAARLQTQLFAPPGPAGAVLISDSFGRPWRVGTVGVAIGCAGLPSVIDLRGQADLFGRTLRVTVVGHADEVASAASLLMGQAAEGSPIVLIRGLPASSTAGARAPANAQPARALQRPPHEDLFT